MDDETYFPTLYKHNGTYTWVIEFHHEDYISYGTGFSLKGNAIVTSSSYFLDQMYDNIFGRRLGESGMNTELVVFNVDHSLGSAMLEFKIPSDEGVAGILHDGDILEEGTQLFAITSMNDKFGLFIKGETKIEWKYQNCFPVERGGMTCADYEPNINEKRLSTYPKAGYYFNKSSLRNSRTGTLWYGYINESKMLASIPLVIINGMPYEYTGYGSPVFDTNSKIVGMLIKSSVSFGGLAIHAKVIEEFLKRCDKKMIEKRDKESKNIKEEKKQEGEGERKSKKRMREGESLEQEKESKEMKREGEGSKMTLVLDDSDSKSFCCNIMDMPGYFNFSDDMTVSLRLADGAVFIVDIGEGVMVNTERTIGHAIQDRLAIVVVISKVERLIIELKLPPKYAYHKIRHAIAASSTAGNFQCFDPLAGNVSLASASAGWSYILQSSAKLYVNLHGIPSDADIFAYPLWGDFYMDTDARLFKKKQPTSAVERSFVLEPLYKIYTQVTGKHQRSVDATSAELVVTRSWALAYKLNVRPLLRLACSSVFGSGTGFTDMLVDHKPSSRDAANRKVEHTGPTRSTIYSSMVYRNPSGPLVVNITRLHPKYDCSTFEDFGRRVCTTVRVLGEEYSPEDEEDMTEKDNTKLWVYQARYRIPINKSPSGSWVLIGGLDEFIMKTPTLCNVDIYSFWPLQFNTLPVAKTATEPLNPNELPKTFEGLRNISKSYTLATFKVEESGEQTILGTGQLYLDSIMKNLRELYLEVEVKVADPVVSFCERVMDTSSKCYAETPNTKNKITMIAESLEKGLAEDMEKGVDWPHKKLSDFVQTKYDWDSLAARGIWAFGPDKQGLNILFDNMLSSELDKPLLNAVKDFVAQGSQWGAREGPLCDKPIRNVKFKIVDAKNAPEPLHRVGGQIIPIPRRVAYSAFLKATPRLMEPVYYIEAFLPMIKSFRFESYLRYHTQGQAFCLSMFDHWATVPGDPLDTIIVLRPLVRAPIQHVAREFMVKTRRKKGMSEDVSNKRLFDEVMVVKLAQQAADFHLQTM